MPVVGMVRWQRTLLVFRLCVEKLYRKGREETQRGAKKIYIKPWCNFVVPLCSVLKIGHKTAAGESCCSNTSKPSFSRRFTRRCAVTSGRCSSK
jgi:hypothetical protein